MKPGYRTSEFWLTLASTLVTVAIALGVLPADEGEQLSEGISALITGIFMIVPIVAYIWNRATVKAAVVTAIANSTPEQAAQIEAM